MVQLGLPAARTASKAFARVKQVIFSQLLMALKTCYGYICSDGVQFQMELRKISRRRPRFVDDAELGHFRLLFCRARQRNCTKIYNTRAQPLNILFGDALVAVVLVICLSSLLCPVHCQVALSCAIVPHAVQSCSMLCHVVPCCAILCSVVPCRATL